MNEPRSSLRSHRALLASLGVGILVLGLVVVLATRRTAPGTETESSLGGKIAPAIAGSSIVGGSRVTLAALRGRFVVVDFFASWCQPCIAEVPELARFVFEHKKMHNASVLGVDIDDSLANGRDFLTRIGATWPAVEDSNGALAEAYGVVDPPQSFLVDPQGRIVATFSAGVTASQLDAVIAAGAWSGQLSAAGIGTTRERIGPRGIGDRLSTRVGWSVFGVGLVVLFSVGALHPHASTVASRVANLDNIIKCPPCSGLSIAQSNTPQAKALRDSVHGWVKAGWSDARIEARVVAIYGPDELLKPQSPVIWVVPILAVLLGVAGLLTLLWRRRRVPQSILVKEDEELVNAALGRRGS